MTQEQLESLNLGLPNDAETLLMVESALQWVLDNTTLGFDVTNIEELKALPAPVRLFILKYIEAMSISSGVVSESIEGLSQSFKSSDKSAILMELADSLLGKWFLSPVRFVPAVSGWDYGS